MTSKLEALEESHKELKKQVDFLTDVVYRAAQMNRVDDLLEHYYNNTKEDK